MGIAISIVSIVMTRGACPLCAQFPESLRGVFSGTVGVMRTPALLLLFAITSLVTTPVLQAKNGAHDRLDSAADLLTDMMKASDKGVPQDLLNKARCVILVPGLKKAAFVLGAKYGRGFAMCRRENGVGWSAPASIRIEGGSVGLQIGGS